jgi:hypothetical protein
MSEIPEWCCGNVLGHNRKCRLVCDLEFNNPGGTKEMRELRKRMLDDYAKLAELPDGPHLLAQRCAEVRISGLGR